MVILAGDVVIGREQEKASKEWPAGNAASWLRFCFQGYIHIGKFQIIDLCIYQLQNVSKTTLKIKLLSAFMQRSLCEPTGKKKRRRNY